MSEQTNKLPSRARRGTTNQPTTHHPFIRKSYQLAIDAGKKGNRTFGAILVHDGRILATGQNTIHTAQGYGHAEYNLVIQSAQKFSEPVLAASTIYASGSPCPRCTCAMLALGVRRIAIGVTAEHLARVMPGAGQRLSTQEIVRRLDWPGVEVLGPFLVEEGLQVFQYWEGGYRPLAELLDGPGLA
jgi:tRNA(Arg) A34 adenosine deaminase TadA